MIIILEESMWLTTLYNDFDGLVRFIQRADADAIFGPRRKLFTFINKANDADEEEWEERKN